MFEKISIKLLKGYDAIRGISENGKSLDSSSRVFRGESVGLEPLIMRI
ncbi:MAG: hypothetical protein ACRECH_15165 [Nitrososphaerales archaeon]